MKDKIRQTFLLFMVFSVLFSSNGYAYFEHICQITKIKSISFQPEMCGKKIDFNHQESKQAEYKKSSCCKISLKAGKVESNQMFKMITFKTLDFINQKTISAFEFFDKTKILPSIFHFSDVSPPKFFIQKIYILIATFLI